MMPWKDQLRLGWRVVRWFCWPEDQKHWANAASWIVIVAGAVAVLYEIWLVLLAGFFLNLIIRFAGQKKKDTRHEEEDT